MYTFLENDYATRRQAVILSSEYSNYTTGVNPRDVVVIVFLYYRDKLNKYLNYITRLPAQIAVVIISSNKEVLDEAQTILQNRENTEYRLKENRGRDVAALLVTAKDIVKQYHYFCFLHDKKEKIEAQKQYIEDWEDLIWRNLICNEVYVSNVLNYMYIHEDVGIVVPPLFIPNSNKIEKGHHWKHGNKENTEKLLGKLLNKSITIDDRNESLAIGSVFWARSEALSNLFEYNWEYSDFPEEPLPDDGTISHAIERCIPFVAANKGLMTISAMSDDYAIERIKIEDEIIFDLIEVFGELKGIRVINQIRALERHFNDLCTMVQDKNIYIYGAGKYGRECLCLLLNKNITPMGFIVSGESVNANEYLGYEVKCISEFVPKDDDMIIIATGEKNAKEITSILSDRGITQYCYYLNIQI